ncbi:MAG: CPBP family intramembrane metalloprotease [Anaerolineae bacterium]|nr:CPBP family intramembrane metalloprotease [Anaerolineae bacterium]
MSESSSILASSTQTVSERRTLLYGAWGIVLVLTLPEIILRAFMHVDTSWMLAARIGLLGILLAATFVWPAIRSLRGLVLVFGVIYGVEGWFFGTLLPQSQFYAQVFGGDPNLAFFGERLVRIGASIVMLLVLLAMGLKPQDFFLSVGNLKAAAEAEKWGIPRKPESWPGFGGRYALIIVALFLLFMVPSLQPSLSNLSVGLVLFAALCAVMNAFAEEFLYRSALLPQVLPLFGKGASLILVASWFGIGHYFGVPSGVTGVIVTTIGGWIFAKAMVETRGMGWPLFLHFVSDFTVYLVILLAGGL